MRSLSVCAGLPLRRVEQCVAVWCGVRPDPPQYGKAKAPNADQQSEFEPASERIMKTSTALARGTFPQGDKFILLIFAYSPGSSLQI